MSEYRISSRYAKSLLDLAVEKKNLEEIHADMKLLSKVCQSSGELRAVLKNPVIQGDMKLKVLQALFKDKMQVMTMSFFQILLRKRREVYMLSIAKEFHKQYNNYKGIQEAQLTTALSVNENLRQEFTDLAAKISGKIPDLKEQIDKDIIGGFILRVDDKQLDNSIKSKLNELRLKLTDQSIL